MLIRYSMAQDGLIFREFGVISRRFQTPVTGTLCAALLTSLFSALFDLQALVSMLSIGVLLAYTVVAISIIILRSVGRLIAIVAVHDIDPLTVVYYTDFPNQWKRQRQAQIATLKHRIYFVPVTISPPKAS